MKLMTDCHYADPDMAARRIMEISNTDNGLNADIARCPRCATRRQAGDWHIKKETASDLGPCLS